MKQALGKGLGALLGGTLKQGGEPHSTPAQPQSQQQLTQPKKETDKTKDNVQLAPVNKILPNSFQPRKEFSAESISELAESIRQKGILQPLIVRKKGDGYELIAGERRLRAAQLAGLAEVPIIVYEVDDRAALEMTLIENLQRENLNPIEEAEGYASLINHFNLTQEEVAAKVGKNRATVANSLRLLKLPAEVQGYIKSGLLSVGHAKVILALGNPENQKLAAEKVIKENLNVRQTEELVAYLQTRKPSTPTPAQVQSSKNISTKDTHIIDLERRLMQKFGTKVTLRYRKGRGTVEIKFFSDDELERILSIVGLEND